MVDITIIFMGVISWFINQLTTGGPHPVQDMGNIYMGIRWEISMDTFYMFFLGKLTLRPCQIGFGRLVSTKSR